MKANYLQDGYLHKYTPEFVADIRSGKISFKDSGLKKSQYSYVMYGWGKKSQYRNKATGITGRHSWHSKPIGSERFDKDGYILLKIGYPRVERRKHIYLWEQANGKIGRDEVLMFLDGDKTNCDLDNLIKVKRKYLGAFNCICRNCVTKEQRLTSINAVMLYCEAKDKERLKKLKDERLMNLQEARHKPIHITVYAMYKEGMNVPTIAERLGLTRSTVRYAIRREKLREQM